MMADDTKAKVDARLKKILGQVGGVQRMVQQDRYCVDVPRGGLPVGCRPKVQMSGFLQSRNVRFPVWFPLSLLPVHLRESRLTLCGGAHCGAPMRSCAQ